MNNDIEIIDDESQEDLTGVSLLQSFFTFENGVFIPKPNIAPLIDDEVLRMVGQSVVEGFNVDWDSMDEWRDYVDTGRDLVKQEKNSKNTHWDGCSNFKSPTMTIAGIKHGDRATTELLRQDDIVKTKVVGKDDGGAKADRAARVAMYQNYQINEEMPEWREEQAKLFSLLPNEGCLFKKTYFDAVEKRPDSTLIRYPNFAVNQDTTSIERMRRFSEVYDLPEDDVLARQRQGVWVELKEDDEKDTGLTSEGETGVADQTEDDKFNQFIEQQGFYDLDGDGYQEPYTFTVHRDTAQVMRITPRFEPENVLIKQQGASQSIKMSELQGDGEVIRIKPNSNITKYGFIRDQQGGFLDVGFYAVLGALTASINSTTNQLVDAGTLANMAGQSGWLAKGFRKKMGNQRFKLGQYKETNLTAQDLKNGVMPLPVGQPSPVLFSLMQMMVSSAQEVSASADLASALGANAPATTTLALIEEQQAFGGAIILRQYQSMGQEFKKLFILNSKYADPAHYQMVVDDPEADYEADFNLKDMNVIPVANPEISSKIQRIQLAEVEMSKLEMIMTTGGDPQPVVKNFLEMIGSTNVGEIYPEMDPMQELEKLIASNPELNEFITQEKQNAMAMAQAQQESIMAEEQRKDAQTAADVDKKASETEKNKITAQLAIESAQNESDKNVVEIQIKQQTLELEQQKLQKDAIALEQEQQKINLTKDKQDKELAIEVTKLEVASQVQLNSEVRENYKAFNPESEEIEDASNQD